MACRRRAPKVSLLRWTVRADGVPVPDPEAVAEGRGRYVCRNPECLAKLARRLPREGIDFSRGESAFRLAIRQGLVQNVPLEPYEN